MHDAQTGLESMLTKMLDEARESLSDNHCEIF